MLTVDVSAREGAGISPFIPNLQGSNTPGGKPWHVHDVICSSDDPVHWPRIDTWDLKAWATMSVPQNASYFTFWGSMNEDHREYSIEVIPAPPGLPPGPQVFSGYTSWCTPDTLMYAAPLDPRQRYNIRVINLVDGRTTDIKKATFWIANTSREDAEVPVAASTSFVTLTALTSASASASAPTFTATKEQTRLNVPAITGIVLGTVAGLALLTLLAFLLRRRHQLRRHRVNPFSS